VTIVGTAQLVEQTPIPVWRQGVGWTTEYSADGDRSQVDAVASQWVGVQGVIEIRYSQPAKPFWRVTVAFAGRSIQDATAPPDPDSQVEVTWAFPRNELQRDLWTHPTVEAQLQNMSMAYRGRFRADVESWLNGQSSVDVAGPDGTSTQLDLTFENLVSNATQFGAQAPAIEAFLRTLAAGQQFYLSSQRVLRVTRTGPTQGQWLVANSFTNRLHTRNRIIRDFAPPEWVRLKMPDGFWFKQEPEEEQAGTRLTMTQEFQFFGEIYSTFAYGDALT
jgi:hypothetical protein